MRRRVTGRRASRGRIDEEPQGRRFRRRRRSSRSSAQRRAPRGRSTVTTGYTVGQAIAGRVDRSRARRRLGHGHRYRHRLPGEPGRAPGRTGTRRPTRRRAVRRVRRLAAHRVGDSSAASAPARGCRSAAAPAARPGRATLVFAVNDDLFSDNAGSFTVTVSLRVLAAAGATATRTTRTAARRASPSKRHVAAGLRRTRAERLRRATEPTPADARPRTQGRQGEGPREELCEDGGRPGRHGAARRPDADRASEAAARRRRRSRGRRAAARRRTSRS